MHPLHTIMIPRMLTLVDTLIQNVDLLGAMMFKHNVFKNILRFHKITVVLCLYYVGYDRCFNFDNEDFIEGLQWLTYWRLNCMAAIFPDNIFKYIFLYQNLIFIHTCEIKYLNLKLYVIEIDSSIDNNSTLVQVIACHHMYHKISNIRRTKSPNLNVSRLVVQLSSPNPMKPAVQSRMKM